MFVGTHSTREWTVPVLSFYCWWECPISLFPGRRKGAPLVENCGLFCAWNLSCPTNFPCLTSTNRNPVSGPSCFPLPCYSTDTAVLPALLLEIVKGVEVGKEHEMTSFMAQLCLPTSWFGIADLLNTLGLIWSNVELKHEDTAQPEPPKQGFGFGSLEGEAGTTWVSGTETLMWSHPCCHQSGVIQGKYAGRAHASSTLQFRPTVLMSVKSSPAFWKCTDRSLL